MKRLVWKLQRSLSGLRAISYLDRTQPVLASQNLQVQRVLLGYQYQETGLTIFKLTTILQVCIMDCHRTAPTHS